MTTPDAPPPQPPPPPPPDERIPELHLPRGCNPLTFGVVMATLEMALLLILWRRCS